jgi:hypothetical protein
MTYRRSGPDRRSERRTFVKNFDTFSAAMAGFAAASFSALKCGDCESISASNGRSESGGTAPEVCLAA